jgi:hypothetical protein
MPACRCVPRKFCTRRESFRGEKQLLPALLTGSEDSEVGARFVIDESKDLSGLGEIISTFQRIGIFGTSVSKTNWFVTKQGEWGIFIPQKF